MSVELIKIDDNTLKGIITDIGSDEISWIDPDTEYE